MVRVFYRLLKKFPHASSGKAHLIAKNVVQEYTHEFECCELHFLKRICVAFFLSQISIYAFANCQQNTLIRPPRDLF